MKQIIGIIGAAGDLGSQLRERVEKHGATVLASDPRLSDPAPLGNIATNADIIHICAPLDKLEEMPMIPNGVMVVLYDSVMNTSRMFNAKKLEGNAAIVHLLMNSQSTAIVASDAPMATETSRHLQSLGFKVKSMTVDEHDRLMARSQAPLALLVQTLLPELYEQQTNGLLTNSGEFLADVLRARQKAWTPATIRSILQNPQLSALLQDMKIALEEVRYNENNG